VKGSATRRTVLVLAPLIALLTAGCVNLPANTSVTSVNKQANTGGGSDVRIWPREPSSADLPEAIVEGFLQTAASAPTNRTIARDYLVGSALKNWDPESVIVFSEESSVTSVSGRSDTFQIYGTEVATVSDTGVYVPVPSPQSIPYQFHLVHDAKNGYRIDGLPPGSGFGIPLTQEAFRSNYTAYNLYYLNADAPSESMIPVPVYLRAQSSDAATAQSLASALLKGPPTWLDGSGGLAASEIALTGQGAVTIGPDDTALVSVKTPNYCTAHSKAACNQLADELLATFSTLGSISRVSVVDPKDNPLGGSGTVDSVMRTYHIGVSTSKSPVYYLDSTNQRVSYFDGHNGPVTAQIGSADRKYAQLAVTNFRTQTFAAVVETGGTKLYLGVPGTSTVSVPWAGHSISSLTWDALGHLWFLDTFAGTTSVYRLDITSGLQAQPELVDVYGVDGATVQRILAAPDGRRIAFVYTEPGSASGPAVYSLGMGVVDDSASEFSLNLSFGINQPVVSGWTNIVDADWHGSQSLAVLGSPQSASPMAIYELNPDGSPVVNSTDLNAVTINPPSSATGIEWSGSTLLASYKTTQTGPGADAIEQYSFATGLWSELTGVQGLAPGYVNWTP
jgi:hypothetical protein